MNSIYIDSTISELRALHQQFHESAASHDTIIDYLTRQVDGIMREHARGNRAMVFHLACWCPPLIGTGAEHIMSITLSADQARTAVAREYGFADWQAVEALGSRSTDPVFEATVDLMLAGNLSALEQALQRDPDLCQAKSAFGHQATLLHYLAANGVESYRQVTPMNAVELCRCLIDAGADVNASANIYGGSRTLGLVTSSAHPANAGLTDQIADLLIKAGAS